MDEYTDNQINEWTKEDLLNSPLLSAEEVEQRGIKALEVLKLDTRIKPMKDPSVQIKVEDLTCINHRLNCLNSDIRDISSKLSRLETSIDKILKQSV